MADFTYTGGNFNFSNTSNTTASTGTHGITIGSGDLVAVYMAADGTGTTITADNAGWTTALNDSPPGLAGLEHALFWKEAGGLEPSSYTFTLNASVKWNVVIKVFTTTGSVEVDSAIAVDYGTPADSRTLRCGAIDGAVISNDALSLAFAGKDSNQTSADLYITADNGFVSAIGDRQGRAAAGAHRIYTTGATFSGFVEMLTVDSNDALNIASASAHISFIVTGGSGGSIIPQIMHHRRQMQ